MNPDFQASVTQPIYFYTKLIYMRLKPGIKVVNFLDEVQYFL